jgi:hypothetical protein
MSIVNNIDSSDDANYDIVQDITVEGGDDGYFWAYSYWNTCKPPCGLGTQARKNLFMFFPNLYRRLKRHSAWMEKEIR